MICEHNSPMTFICESHFLVSVSVSLFDSLMNGRAKLLIKMNPFTIYCSSKGLLGGCFEHSSATQHPANSKQARKSPFRAHPGDISKNRAWKTAEMVQWVFSEVFQNMGFARALPGSTHLTARSLQPIWKSYALGFRRQLIQINNVWVTGISRSRLLQTYGMGRQLSKSDRYV